AILPSPRIWGAIQEPSERLLARVPPFAERRAESVLQPDLEDAVEKQATAFGGHLRRRHPPCDPNLVCDRQDLIGEAVLRLPLVEHGARPAIADRGRAFEKLTERPPLVRRVVAEQRRRGIR